MNGKDHKRHHDHVDIEMEEKSERRTQSQNHAEEQGERRTQSQKHPVEQGERRTQSQRHPEEQGERRTQSQKYPVEQGERRIQSQKYPEEQGERRTQSQRHPEEQGERRTQSQKYPEKQGERRTQSQKYPEEQGERRTQSQKYTEEQGERRTQSQKYPEEQGERRTQSKKHVLDAEQKERRSRSPRPVQDDWKNPSGSINGEHEENRDSTRSKSGNRPHRRLSDDGDAYHLIREASYRKDPRRASEPAPVANIKPRYPPPPELETYPTQPRSFLWLAMLTAIVNIVFGVIALVCAITSDNAWAAGKRDEAKKRGRYALGFCILGIICTAILIIVVPVSFKYMHA